MNKIFSILSDWSDKLFSTLLERKTRRMEELDKIATAVDEHYKPEKTLTQKINELSEDNESAYAECDRMIRSFANAIIGMIRRRTDFETSLCAYAVSSSVAFLNYAELSLKQYTK